jgi:hypothetical protein
MAEKVNLIDLDIDVSKVITDTIKMKQELAVLASQAKLAKDKFGELSSEYMLYSASLKSTQKDISTNEQLLTKLSGAQSEQAGTLKILTAENAKLRNEQQGLNLLTAEGVKRNEEINSKINENTKFIKANSDTLVQQKMNVGNYASALEGLPGPLGGAVNGIKGMIASAKAFIATPFGMIVAAIALAVGVLVSVFKSFQPVLDKIEQGIAAVGAVLSVLKDGVLGLITGTKSLSETFTGLGDRMNEAAKAAIELKKAQQDLDDLTMLQIENQAKYKRQIDELLLQSKNRTLSEKERIALIDEALKIEEKAYNEKKKIADEQLKQAEGQIALEASLNDEEKKMLKEGGVAYALELQNKKGLDDKYVKALAEAKANEENILDESVAMREKAQNRSDALADKSEADEAKRLEKAKALAEKKQKENEEAAKKLLDDTLKDVEKKKKILEDELNFYKLHNKTKLESDKLLSQESVNQEKIRLENIRNAELETAYGTISDAEGLKVKKLEIDQAYNDEVKSLNKDFEAQKRDEQLALLDANYNLEMEMLEGNLLAQFEKQKQYLKKQQEEELRVAKLAGANTEIINKKYAQAEIAIDRAVLAAKLDSLSSLAGNISKLFGEGTAMGKAAATAQVAIDTYQAAFAAYKSTVGIPVVGPFLAPVAAGVAAALGAKAIKDIWAVKVDIPKSSLGGSDSSSSISSGGGGTSSINTSYVGGANNLQNYEAVKASVNPEIGQGIVSRTQSYGSDTIAAGVSQGMSKVNLQPTLVIDDVTNKQTQSDLNKKTQVL